MCRVCCVLCILRKSLSVFVYFDGQFFFLYVMESLILCVLAETLIMFCVLNF